jgi:hypothetical protein
MGPSGDWETADGTARASSASGSTFVPLAKICSAAPCVTFDDHHDEHAVFDDFYDADVLV